MNPLPEAPSRPAGAPARPPRRDLWIAALLALFAFGVYNANFRSISQGDCFPARFLPLILLRHGTLYLDPLAGAVSRNHPTPYWIVALPDGRKASLYPVVTPILVAPLYLPAVLYLNARGWTEPRLSALAEVMEKLAASFVASLAAAVLYLGLRRRAPERLALALALLFAFGTNTWTTSSQALWQHGPGELLVAAALWAVTGPAKRWPVLLAGLCLGLLPANRPPDLILALGFLPWAWVWARGRRLLLLAAGSAVALAALAYNLSVFGDPRGGYGVAVFAQGYAQFFDRPLLSGSAGLLVSPARGLFVYAPFLLLLPLAAARIFRRAEPRLLALGLALAVALQVVFYARTDWRGGYSWGPRFLTDALPILVWLLVPALLAERRRWARGAFFAAALFSVWVQTVGAFRYDGSSELLVFEGGDPANRSLRPAWDWRLSPILHEARGPLAERNVAHRLFDL